MFVPKRKPGAHQVAASQSKNFNGCHIYLESGSDCRFWRFFINERNVMLHACIGWSQVVETIKRGAENGNTCIGIIDNDFRSLVTYPETLPNNIFTTDCHDIEMMMLNTEAAKRVITHFDVSGKIAEFERDEGNILEYVFGITDSIGLLKLVDKKSGLNMVFKKVGKDQNIVLPNYERFLDKTCHYISDDELIAYMCAWSTNQKKIPRKSEKEIKALIDKEKQANHDTMQLSCGHDACYVLAYVLKKRIVNKINVTKDNIEELLSVAYTKESFRNTQLYKELIGWSRKYNIQVLKV